jgi:3-dehydroquinate synthase
MAQPIIVRVDLPGRGYDIEIGSGLLDALGSRLKRFANARRVAIITDANVGPMFADRVVASLAGAGFATTLATIPAGETSKSLEIAGELFDVLAEDRHERGDPIVALGGGVVSDLAGFVAATWMRGVPWVVCPTTLEGMIDAAIGGKTGLNHPVAKNLIGAVHQPAAVCADIACLDSLPDREFVAALAESVKHAVIADETFLTWHDQSLEALRTKAPQTLVDLIARNCQIKANIVAADERESSTKSVGRAALNFGHTVGHAIETASRHRMRHGEAVALGMIAEMDLAVRRAGFSTAQRDRVESLLAAVKLPSKLESSNRIAEIVELMQHDKKRSAGELRLAVPSSIGQMTWLSAPARADIESALARLYT